mmetsp:Transcript_2040/g.5733  ORF Transcript_2040/g.5733 Transcript_2040/m.5733 type:complete len:275 (-) Transcript_2040:550-1374(-)
MGRRQEGAGKREEGPGKRQDGELWPLGDQMRPRAACAHAATGTLVIEYSASSQMRRIIVTVSTGKSPMADSLLSITALVPSRTALATSQASALVGKGLSSIDASISVAVTTILPASFAFLIISFCAKGTRYTPSSTPRSPRATMMPSEMATISSKFFTPASFSIFGMIWMLRPFMPRVSLMNLTSSALWTKEAKTMSTPWATPKLTRSLMSFSCSTGRSTWMPGRLQFFLSPREQSFITSVMTWSVPTVFTFREREPSAQRMMLPALTDEQSLG